MMTSEMIGAISRFFFLTLLDEQAAFEATARALQIWRGKLSRSTHPETEAEGLLAATLAQQWQALKETAARTGQPMVFAMQDWRLPKGLDLGPWLEFRREADPEEFFTVLAVKVAGLTGAGVAQGLKISEGTVHHRLARGLRRLGGISGNTGAGGNRA
jgi:hypothetical protein